MNLTKLKDSMAQVGYQVSDLKTDDKYHRFSIEGRKGKPGYYQIRKTAAGMIARYGDFVSGNSYTRKENGNHVSLSPEEKQALEIELAKEAKALEAAVKRKHDQGAMAANFFWNTVEEINTHGYLSNKQVKNYGLKICTIGSYEGWLMVPGYNADGELRTVNYIRYDGEKRFETGAEKKGAFFSIPGDDKIILCEGYSTSASIHDATGHTVNVAFDAGNIFHVAKNVREKHPDSEIIIAADNDKWKPEIGNTGVDAATEAAIEINAKLSIPEFKDTSTEPTDYNDLANLEGPEAVRAQIEAARPVDNVRALKTEVSKILDLDIIEREFARDRLSDKYNVRKSIIDEYISQLCEQSQDEKIKSIVSDVRPAADPVDGAELLNIISADLSRRVILPEGAADASTLWIALTYCNEAFNILPILGITSPTKRCGKTTCIEILQGLCSKGLAASNLTPAAAFRTIEKYKPTLLIDEADTFLKDNDELRGILNSGHTRASAYVIRVEGDNHEPVKFSTWAPKAIGMIGSLPDTIEDRAIVIQLRRKMPGEKVIKTGLDFTQQATGIRSKLKRWADDHIDQLRRACVEVPSSGNDRADDNWYPLFAIAHIVGGDWPDKCKAAMSKLCQVRDDEAIGYKLLLDIPGHIRIPHQ